jgi:hypothetical protein
MQAALGSLAVSDVVDSPFGPLRFFDGVPLPETVETIYDALDLMRGIEVFMNSMPGASLVAMRRGIGSIGVDSPKTIGCTDPRANSGAFFLTPNTETTYGTTFLDLKAWGPTVIEAPPMSLCVVDDYWFRYVADMGVAGPDRGQGGKYLFLPPGYEGDEPDGYFTYRPSTFVNWVVLRALGGIEDLKKTRIYPLSDADAPAANEWINMADFAFNTVHANDFSFFDEVNELVQAEPVEALDPERAGQLAAIGITNGKPFSPDDRMRAILQNAAQIGAGMSRAISYWPRDPEARLYGSWQNGFVGGSYEFLRNGARLLDARTMFHYLATVITPAMAHAQPGAGSAYAFTVHDRTGDLFDGAKSYSLHVEPEVPVKNFWSIDIYDTQTRSLIQVESTRYPALGSLSESLQQNDDGSHDLYVGPAPPAGKESNWIESIPGKSWFTIFRLYGPLQPWFDQTWNLNDFERLD